VEPVEITEFVGWWVGGTEDVVTTIVLEGVLLTGAVLVDKVMGTEKVATREQAAEHRLIRSSSLFPVQSLRYSGIFLASVMVPLSHLVQSV
jgi:hypothetical protein